MTSALQKISLRQILNRTSKCDLWDTVEGLCFFMFGDILSQLLATKAVVAVL